MSDIAVALKILAHGVGLPPPHYASLLAVGCDLSAAVPEGQTQSLSPGQRSLIPTGLALALPPGFEAQIRPRSGLALRHGITVLNAPGTIDADYRGEILVLLVNFGTEAIAIERGMRIAQLVLAPVSRARFILTEDLDATVRNAGGFGSTGFHGPDPV